VAGPVKTDLEWSQLARDYWNGGYPTHAASL